MSDRLDFARKIAFVCGISTAVVSAHAAAYAANASVAGSANAGANINGSVPGAMPGAVPNVTNSTPPYTTNSTVPNTTNATPPNVTNAVPPNTINGVAAPVPNNVNGGVPTQPNVNPNAYSAKQPNGVAANWNAEDQYWRNNFSGRPYAHDNVNYTMYRPAFQFGVNTFNQNGGRPFNDINQEQLRASWQQANPNSTLTWDQAELAIRDSYDRLYDRRVNGTPATNNTP